MKQYKLKRWYPDIPSYMDNGFIIDYYEEEGKAIYTYPNGCRLGFSLPTHHLECSDFWEEVKQPLFVTDDGVELFNEADKLFIVNKRCYKKESKISNIYDKTNRKDFKYFFHESNADEYIWRNKRVFSYEDFIRWGNVPYERVIKQLAKERSKE